ncbi:MAG: nucleotidyltransferase family protein [Prevotella sp.]|nr:nucleotidyltransferase family protein [Prevotella sp.]
MTKRDFIFSLVRSGLWQQQLSHFEMAAWQYKEVMVEAEKQCVIGLVADCLQSNNMKLPRKCVTHMLRLSNTLMLENKRLNENVLDLTQLMTENHIGFVVVKGQSIGASYPKPLLRVPGDIDFYVVQNDFDRAVSVINKHWGLSLNSDKEGKHLDFNTNGNHFEMHRILMGFPKEETKRDFQALVEKYPFEQVLIDGQQVPTLMPTLNVFYTFLHLYNHVVKLGVAIRQFCDVAILLHQYKERIDRGLLSEWLDTYDFKRAFAAIGHILVDKLGLPVEDFPLEIKDKDKKNGEKILDLVWSHGNWGMYDRDWGEKGSVKYYWSKIRIRVSSQMLFSHLSPKFSKSIILEDTPRRVYSAIVSKLRKLKK